MFGPSAPTILRWVKAHRGERAGFERLDYENIQTKGIDPAGFRGDCGYMGLDRLRDDGSDRGRAVSNTPFFDTYHSFQDVGATDLEALRATLTVGNWRCHHPLFDEAGKYVEDTKSREGSTARCQVCGLFRGDPPCHIFPNQEAALLMLRHSLIQDHKLQYCEGAD